MSNGDPPWEYPRTPVVLIPVADDSLHRLMEVAIVKNSYVVAGVSKGEALTNSLEARTQNISALESRLVCVMCRYLQTSSMSIVALAFGRDEASLKKMLESGADYFIGRPSSPEALISRIGTILPDAAWDWACNEDGRLTFLDLELDVTEHRVRRSGHTIHLAPTEFRLLHLLMRDPHRVHSRDELQSAAWPRSVHLGPRTVDVHIGRLRAALKKAGGPDLIRTVRSVGYGLSK